jgi:hypothetical protein
MEVLRMADIMFNVLVVGCLLNPVITLIGAWLDLRSKG